MRIDRLFLAVICFLTVVAGPGIASAHEVYVLSPQEISTAIETPSVDPLRAIPGHELQFLFWGALVLVILLLVLSASVSRIFEAYFDPFLVRLKKYAPFIARVTFGLALILSGYFGAFFGPELPVAASMSAGAAHMLGMGLMIAGACVAIGFLTRILSFLVIAVFAYAVFVYHSYMLTYVNYLGEAILFAILGGGRWSVDRSFRPLRRLDDAFKGMGAGLERYSFLILRILYGVAVFFASFYAKFLHSNLAMDTVLNYDLTQYFHFTPLFLVLGAFLIEAILGICFAAGFEIRFAAIFFTIFMTMSLIFFGESVWPHLILFGVNAALFAHGYDKYTAERALFQGKKLGEPVL